MYLVECYNDETVLRALGVRSQDIRRMKGKGNVLNRLKRDGTIDFIGMVDDDPRSPHPVPLAPFVRHEQRSDLTLYGWNSNRLIVVHDTLEDWIFRAMNGCGLDPLQHLAASDAAMLHRMESRVVDPKLTRAIEALAASRSVHLSVLREFLGLQA